MSSRSTAVLYLCSDAFAECIYIFSAFLSLFICLTPLQILVFCFRVWWSLHEIMAIKTSLTVLQCRSNVTSRWPRVTVAKALHCAYHELSPLGSSVLQSGSYSVFTFSPAADSISTSVCLSVCLIADPVCSPGSNHMQSLRATAQTWALCLFTMFTWGGCYTGLLSNFVYWLSSFFVPLSICSFA